MYVHGKICGCLSFNQIIGSCVIIFNSNTRSFLFKRGTLIQAEVLIKNLMYCIFVSKIAMNSILAKFLTCIVENLDYSGVRSPLNICIFKTILNLFSYGKKAILILDEEKYIIP